MAKRGWPLLCCRLVFWVGIAMRCYDVTAVPCSFTAATDDGVDAQCSHLRKTRFPGNWPDDVVSLDMSSNFLTSLAGLADRQLADLRNLDVSRNQLTSLSDDAFRHVPQLRALDLGHNALVTLPDDAFRGLNDLTSLVLTNTSLLPLSASSFLRHVTGLLSLDLSNNALRVVPTAALQLASRLERLDLSGTALQRVANHSLERLHGVRHLSLRDNNLTSLQPAAFSGLQRLVTLDLRHNQLELNNRAYPPGVFSPLVALESLFLNGNDARRFGDYPLNVFDPLRFLRALSIDTFSVPDFQAAFTSLTQLTSLTLQSDDDRSGGGGCSMNRVSNDTFRAFPHLQTLVIRNCPLFRVDLCAFCHLPQLTSLTVKGQHRLNLDHLLLALYGLQNQTLKLVDFSNSKWRELSTILDETNWLYLTNVCIENLDLRESGIAGMSSKILRGEGMFMTCLKHLDLSLNTIRGGDESFLLRMTTVFTNIESLQLQNQRSFIQGETNRRAEDDDAAPKSDLVVHVDFPSSLRSLNMSRSIQHVPRLPRQVDFPLAGNLSVLDFSYSGAYACDTAITGLSAIRTFDFSGNNCSVMGAGVFRHMPTLRSLRLADLLLREEFLFLHGSQELLRPLAELEELDLAQNDLHDLPDDLLRHQPRLQRLGLARNRFQVSKGIPLDSFGA